MILFKRPSIPIYLLLRNESKNFFSKSAPSNHFLPVCICKLNSTKTLKEKKFIFHEFHSTSSKYFQEDHKTKAITILDSVRKVRESPTAALVLGFAGLIPFVAAPAYIVFSGVFLPTLAYAQLAYGATILSFVGGVRWGLTLPHDSPQSPDWHNLGYSVTPPLIAWSALLVSPTLGSLIIMGGLGLSGYMDLAMWGYPSWFKGLRFCLTLVSVLSLWTTFTCSFLLSSDQGDRDKKVVM